MSALNPHIAIILYFTICSEGLNPCQTLIFDHAVKHYTELSQCNFNLRYFLGTKNLTVLSRFCRPFTKPFSKALFMITLRIMAP